MGIWASFLDALMDSMKSMLSDSLWVRISSCVGVNSPYITDVQYGPIKFKYWVSAECARSPLMMALAWSSPWKKARWNAALTSSLSSIVAEAGRGLIILCMAHLALAPTWSLKYSCWRDTLPRPKSVISARASCGWLGFQHREICGNMMKWPSGILCLRRNLQISA